MNLIDVIAKFARMSPRSTAFVEVRPLSGLRQEIRWEEFHDRTNRIANRLIQEGVQRQDKVFLLGRNSIRWLEAYFAILKTGAWAVPLNFRFTDEDILYCAGVAEPSAFIFDEEYGERVRGLRKKLNAVSHYCVIGPDRAEEFVTVEDLVEKRFAAIRPPLRCPTRMNAPSISPQAPQAFPNRCFLDKKLS